VALVRTDVSEEGNEVGGACSANGGEEVIGEKARGKETTRKTKMQVGG
jgi:hypothetical protein